MKAWVLHGVNDFRYEEVCRPTLISGEVLVRVKAIGICGSDIPRVYKDGAHRMPLIIGHEFAGEVMEVGEDVCGEWLGARVGVFPLLPCKECEPCRRKMYEMCRNYSYLGSRRDGGFAEYVAVPVWNLLRLPENVSFEEAAMLEPMAVAVHAMRRVLPKTEETVVVCGLGTIGMLLTMFLKESGVENVLVVGNKDFQRKTVCSMGVEAVQYCDCNAQDVEAWILEKTEGQGADVFFECVGKEETYSQAISLTGLAGKVCLVGNPHSDMQLSQKVYWKILRNQLCITGTWNSSFTHEESDDWHYVLERLEKGKIQPAKMISHRYEPEKAISGFEIMREKKEEYLKIIVSGE